MSDRVTPDNPTGDREIFVINANGTGLTQLTKNGATDESPAWSADGKKVVFSSDRKSNNTDIYVMNADGSRQLKITNAAPSASGINAPDSVKAGTTFTISLNKPTDASTVDRQSFQYRFDCGDGSGYGAFNSTNSRRCPTSAPGNRKVRGQVRDKDGDVSGHYTKTVKVLPLLRINNVKVTEGNSGSKNAVFTVRLSAPSQQKVTVNYAMANGTAKAPGDYAAKSGTLSFNAGETTKTIPVSIQGDRLKESKETFFVRLAGANNAAFADAEGQGTIVDND